MAKKSKKVDIKNTPSAAVAKLTVPSKKVSDSNAVFSTSWEYPKVCFDETKNDRFQGVLVQWIVDLDKTPSSAVDTKVKISSKVAKTDSKGKPKKDSKGNVLYKTSKKTIKTTAISGASNRVLYLQRKNGDGVKAASLSVNRKSYYPFSNVSQTMVRLYKARSSKYKNNKWSLSRLVSAGSTTLPNLNVEINTFNKGGTPKIYSLSALKSFPRNKNPKGKVFYKKKTDTFTKTVKNPYLYGIGVQVQGWNSKTPTVTGNAATKKTAGWSNKVPTQSAYRGLSRPASPSLSGPSVAGEASNLAVTFSVDASADDGTKSAERYDTVYTLSKKTAFLSGSKLKTTTGKIYSNKTTTSTKFDISRNPNGDMPSGRTFYTLRPNEYLRYDFTAYNRGFCGDSGTSSKSFTYAHPHDTAIKSITKKGIHYTVTFEVTSAGNIRYTKKYVLQGLINYRPSGAGYDKPVDDWTDAEWENAANLENSWKDIYAIGSGAIKNNKAAFTVLVSDTTPDPFKRTYYRVVAENDIYGIPGIPSRPKVVGGFYKIPSAASEETKILSATPTEDGQSILAVVAFMKTLNSSGYMNSNGTEMSWDTASYGWSSTQPPSTYDFKDAAMDSGRIKPVNNVTKNANASKKYLANVPNNGKWFFTSYYIRGLQTDERYYIKGRRFLKDTETRETDSYGPYGELSAGEGNNKVMATVEVTAVPKDVKLSVPERLIYGRDLSVSWSYETNEVQKEYDVLWTVAAGDSGKAKAKTLVSKVDSAPYAVVKWSDVEGKIFKNNIYLTVKVRTENGWTNLSDVKTVKVVRPPLASLNKIDPLVNQPLVMTLGTNDPEASAVVRIISNQIVDWGPAGPDNQADGTIIHTNKIFSPSWKATTLADNTTWYYINYSVPTSDFRNNATYTVEYTAVVDDTGLDSDTIDDEGNVVKQTTDFYVSYNDEVIIPNFYVVADPLDEEHGSSARISIPDVSGNEGCVADIYRVTPDGSYLLKGDIENWRNATVLDPFPPYSRHEPCVYRLCLRSRNGVREWGDRSYSLPGYSIRFDWGDEESESHGGYSHLTLPYNLKWSDNWTKNARVDLHLDGTYNGYWRGGVDHKNTMSTDIVKLTGAEQIARVMALAKHPGPVLVRLPNGCAFCANVNVTNLDVSYDSLVVAASFSAQEIRMPEKYTGDAASVTAGLYVPRF